MYRVIRESVLCCFRLPGVCVGHRAGRVSGKASLSRLSIAEAVEALGIEVDVLRRIREDFIRYERDRHGRVYVLVGAYSNLPHVDHSRRRKPQDEAIIRDLEAQAAYLRQAPGPLEAPPRTPGTPEEPL
jgi:hypothetical protein